MPTYEYLCANCGHEFEKLQSITAKPLRKCEGCGKMKLRRLIGSGSGIIFKGSGFYQTDYRTESYKNGESNAKKSTTKSSEKSKDTKSKSKDKKSDKKSNPEKK